MRKHQTVHKGKRNPDGNMPFWKFHAYISLLLFFVIGGIFYAVYTAFPQTLGNMILMNQSLNIIAWVYMIYALKIYSNKDVARMIAESVSEYLFEEED